MTLVLLDLLLEFLVIICHWLFPNGVGVFDEDLDRGVLHLDEELQGELGDLSLLAIGSSCVVFDGFVATGANKLVPKFRLAVSRFTIPGEGVDDGVVVDAENRPLLLVWLELWYCVLVVGCTGFPRFTLFA